MDNYDVITIENKPPRKLAYAECRKILAIGYEEEDKIININDKQD